MRFDSLSLIIVIQFVISFSFLCEQQITVGRVEEIAWKFLFENDFKKNF